MLYTAGEVTTKEANKQFLIFNDKALLGANGNKGIK